MKDFYFWLSLPFTLGTSTSELKSLVLQTNQNLEELQEEISSTKGTILNLIIQNQINMQGDQVAPTQSIEQQLDGVMQILEQKKQSLVKKALELTQLHFNMISQKFQQKSSELKLEQLKLCLGCCRTVLNKARDEIEYSEDALERSVFIKIKNQAAKSLRKICNRVEEILNEHKENEEAETGISQDDTQLEEDQEFTRNQTVNTQNQNQITQREITQVSDENIYEQNKIKRKHENTNEEGIFVNKKTKLSSIR